MTEVFNLLMCIPICIFALYVDKSISQGIRTQNGCLADVCFILDKSNGLQTEWVPMVNFLKTFVEKLTISDSATKVGVVTFDDFGQLPIRLDGYGSKDELKAALEMLDGNPGFGRNIDAGLFTARTECFSPAKGDRDNAPDIAVLITNGDSEFYYANQESEELRARGVTILAIAVGSGINHDLLAAVANGKDNVFSDVDYGRFVNDPSLILGSSCSTKEYCDGHVFNNWNTATFPPLNDCPRLSTPLIKNNEFYFECFVNYTSQGGDDRYRVTFLFDDVPDANVPVEDLSPNETVATLNQYYLRGHMGKSLRCQVSTYRKVPGIAPGIAPVVGPAVPSQSYWMGISFSHRVLDVYETDNNDTTPLDNAALLYVYSTLPILCPNAVTTDCNLGLAITSGKFLAVFQNQSNLIRKCFFKFSPDDWKQNESLAYSQDRPLEVIAQRMAVRKPIREGSISMTTSPINYTWAGKMYSPWENYVPETIPILAGGAIISVDLVDNRVWNNNDCLNVYVNVPAELLGHMEGLCGNFDDNKGNEFYIKSKNKTFTEKDFEKEWEVDQGSNYFNCVDKKTTSAFEEFCQCEGPHDQNAVAGTPGIICGSVDPLLLIGRTGEEVKALLPRFLKTNGVRGRRKKRNTDDEFFTDDFDDTYEMTDLNNYPDIIEEVPEWGTFGISEAAANEHCISTMEKSPSYSVCRENLPESIIRDMIRSCVADIQITGDLSSANALVISIQVECLFNFVATLDIDDTATASSHPVVVGFLTSFGSTTCSRNCSGRGTCKDGNCMCVENFHGADCSVEKRTPPANVTYLAPALCDTQDRPCRSAQLQAENIVNSGLLACKVTVKLNKTGSVAKAYMYNATLLTADTVLCPLPDPNSLLDIKLSVYMYTYSISLTNEGEVFSELPSQQQHRRVWNSDWIWESCFQEGIFLHRDETCEIDGECYTAGTKKKDSHCTCAPSKNGEGWSDCEASSAGQTQQLIFNLGTLFLTIILFTQVLQAAVM